MVKWLFYVPGHFYSTMAHTHTHIYSTHTHKHTHNAHACTWYSFFIWTSNFQFSLLNIRIPIVLNLSLPEFIPEVKKKKIPPWNVDFTTFWNSNDTPESCLLWFHGTKPRMPWGGREPLLELMCGNCFILHELALILPKTRERLNLAILMTEPFTPLPGMSLGTSSSDYIPYLVSKHQ